MQVRWYPTHGYQRDQPSCFTGSGSSDRQRKNSDADVKKLLPTLDIGSHINAAPQPLPEAGATLERTLEAVGCRRLFGVGSGTAYRPRWTRSLSYPLWLLRLLSYSGFPMDPLAPC